NLPDVCERNHQCYLLEAVVISPAVEAQHFSFNPETQTEDYFLIVSRLVTYKRIDLAIEACNKLHLPLVIVGSGRDLERLKKMAGPTIRFLGRLSDKEVLYYYTHCRAFLFPSEEDFGITPLEAQASGRPVIAYSAGGALASVIDGVTGTFFKEQTVESLASVLEAFDEHRFDTQTMRNHALDFDMPRFHRRILQFIEAKMSAGKLRELRTSTSDLVR